SDLLPPPGEDPLRPGDPAGPRRARGGAGPKAGRRTPRLTRGRRRPTRGAVDRHGALYRARRGGRASAWRFGSRRGRAAFFGGLAEGSEVPNLPPMDPRLRFALAGLALLLAWIPWLGAALALGGLLFVAKDRRQGVMLGLALLLGLLSTAAFLALPEGSTGAD